MAGPAPSPPRRARLLAAAFLLLAACPQGGGTPDAGPVDAGPTCAARADCEGGLVCTDGQCTECEYDRECEGNELCDPVKRVCEYLPCYGGDCTVHADCSLGEFCVQGLCLKAEGSSSGGDCPVVTPCAKDTDCPEGLACNGRTLVCEKPVPCTSDANCEGDLYCDVALGKCRQGCTAETASDVCPTGFSCDSGRCVECTADADCGAGLTCQAELGRCVGSATCFTDRDCQRPLVCNRQTGKCTTQPPPCLSNEDCLTGEVCDLRAGACVTAECTPDALEPDDTLATAAPVDPGLLSNLTLCPGDADYYRLALGAGDRVSLTLNPPPLSGANFEMRLWDPRPQVVASSNNLQIDYTVLEAGDYGLEIATADARATYGLQYLVARGVPCEDDGYEPNDAFTEAASLGEGTFVNLTKCPGDGEWYVVAVPRDRGVHVELSYDPLAGDLDLYVYDSDGTTLLGKSATADPVETVDVASASAGRVFVEVRSDDRVSTQYDLTVALTEAAP